MSDDVQARYSQKIQVRHKDTYSPEITAGQIVWESGFVQTGQRKCPPSHGKYRNEGQADPRMLIC